MDFKVDSVVAFGIPTEMLGPPHLDAEEVEADIELGDVSSNQQLPACDNLIFSKRPDLDSGLCTPRTEEIHSGLDGGGGVSKWRLDPQDGRTVDCAEMAAEDSRNNVEEHVKTSAPEQNMCSIPKPAQPSEIGSDLKVSGIDQSKPMMELKEEDVEEEIPEADETQLLGAVAQLQNLSPTSHEKSFISEDDIMAASDSEESHAFGGGDRRPLLERAEGHKRPAEFASGSLHVTAGQGLMAAAQHLLRSAQGRRGHANRESLSSEDDHEDLLSLLNHEGGIPGKENGHVPLACSDVGPKVSCQDLRAEGRALAPKLLPPGPVSHGLAWTERQGPSPSPQLLKEGSGPEETISSSSSLEVQSWEDSDPSRTAMAAPRLNCMEESSASDTVGKANLSSFLAHKEVPGPCEPEDLLDGVIFGAKYLGSTQLVSERNPSTTERMAQAQEAMDRIKAPEGESQPKTEVDLFVSTQRIKVLTADSQEAMMDHPLQTISYIADIGNTVVLMARRKPPRRAIASAEKQLYKMICHVFDSSDAQLIAQAIGQAFGVAYQLFLHSSGMNPGQPGSLRCEDDDDEQAMLAKGEELYNGDLAHFCKQENCKEVIIAKQKGEILGVVIVESGWGSILPTVVIANLMHQGAAERSGKLSIGDRIMSVNGTSLVGLPLAVCQSIIRDLKNQTEVTLSIVHCPPVTTAIVRRPDTKYPLGFCVENGIICSLIRGGIAERGGVRVGHRIIEINGQSMVAVPQEKVIQILTQAVSEMPLNKYPLCKCVCARQREARVSERCHVNQPACSDSLPFEFSCLRGLYC